MMEVEEVEEEVVEEEEERTWTNEEVEEVAGP